jgi:hypothetical protein
MRDNMSCVRLWDLERDRRLTSRKHCNLHRYVERIIITENFISNVIDKINLSKLKKYFSTNFYNHACNRIFNCNSTK